MTQGIRWVDGVKLISKDTRQETEDEANEWFRANKSCIVKSINFVAHRYSSTLVIHYQKPDREWGQE
jgi:hypothetical protein